MFVRTSVPSTSKNAALPRSAMIHGPVDRRLPGWQGRGRVSQPAALEVPPRGASDRLGKRSGGVKSEALARLRRVADPPRREDLPRELPVEREAPARRLRDEVRRRGRGGEQPARDRDATDAPPERAARLAHQALRGRPLAGCEEERLAAGLGPVGEEEEAARAVVDVDPRERPVAETEREPEPRDAEEE